MKNLFGAQDLMEIVQNGVGELAANAIDVQRNADKEEEGLQGFVLDSTKS